MYFVQDWNSLAFTLDKKLENLDRQNIGTDGCKNLDGQNIGADCCKNLRQLLSSLTLGKLLLKKSRQFREAHLARPCVNRKTNSGD